MLWILAGNNAGIRNCNFNFTTNAWHAVARALGGPITSGPNSTWATGTAVFTNFQDLFFDDNYLTTTANQHSSEGVGFGDAIGISVRRNKLFGVGDDYVGLHYDINGWVEDNEVTSIVGRVYMGNSQNIWVARNKVTRIVDPNTGLWAQGMFLKAEMEATATTSQAPMNIHVTENTFICPATLDSGSNPCNAATWMGFYAVQDGLFIRDNICQMDSNYATGQSCIAIAPFFITSWTGPAGNPDYSNGGHIRLRNVVIKDNKATGVGTGILGIDQQNLNGVVAADFVGPILVDGNVADEYTWQAGAQIQFSASNTSRTGASSSFLNVSALSVLRNKSIDFPFAGLTSSYSYLSPFGPIYSAGSTGSAGLGAPFIADRAGRIVGIIFSVGSTPSSGATFNLAVYDNGALLIGWALQSTPNAVYWVNDYDGQTGTTFAAGDKLAVYLGNNNNTVTEAGVARMIVQYAN